MYAQPNPASPFFSTKVLKWQFASSATVAPRLCAWPVGVHLSAFTSYAHCRWSPNRPQPFDLLPLCESPRHLSASAVSLSLIARRFASIRPSKDRFLPRRLPAIYAHSSRTFLFQRDAPHRCPCFFLYFCLALPAPAPKRVRESSLDRLL